LSQQKNKTKNIRFFQIAVIIVFIIAVATISYKKYDSTLQETSKNLNKKIISLHFETFKKISNLFVKDSEGHFVEEVIKSKQLREQFEDMLNLIRISTVQNLFVVSRNEDKEYYFLLDSEKDPKKHSNIFEPFDPLGDAWDKCYTRQKAQIFYHEKNKNLWITIVYPIIEKGKTVAVIGADISHQLDIKMKKKLEDFTYFFFWLMFLSILLFTVLYFLTLYFRTKYYDAYIDPLTQVYNRKYLHDIVIKKLARSYQLYMLDIDLFKRVNDTYGHDAGDYILQEVAKRVNSLIRDEDTLVRFGGEEFLIYTTTLDREKSLEFANRIRERVKSKPIVYKDAVCYITISVGVNFHATKESSFNEMLVRADKALYEAKKAGRDCVRSYEGED